MENLKKEKNINKKSQYLKSLLIVICFFCIAISVITTSVTISLKNTYAENLHSISQTTEAVKHTNDNEEENISLGDGNTIQEISSYADNKSSEESKKPEYTEDKTLMIYFAVYYIDEKPEKDSSKWNIKPYPAPQISTPGMTYDENLAYTASTVCHMSYADKDYYIYGEGVLGHNREYIKVNVLTNSLPPAPQLDVIKSSNGYEYIGYDFYEEHCFYKYNSTKKLPYATTKNHLYGTTIKSDIKTNGYEYMYCLTLSLYFYKPSTFTLESENLDYGRFSTTENMQFNNATSKLKIHNIQMGYTIQTKNIKEPNVVAIISGTYKYIENGKYKTQEKTIKCYIITNDYCYLSNTSFYKNICINKTTDYEMKCSFTHSVISVSFSIKLNVSNFNELDLFVSFGLINKKIEVSSDEIEPIIILDNIPAGSLTSLTIHVSNTNQKKFHISSTELTSESIIKEKDVIDYYNITEYKKFEESLSLFGISCYITELYSINVESRTTEPTNFKHSYLKIYNVDFNPNLIGYNNFVNGFDFYGFSLSEDSLEKVNILTENKNITIYANWKKTLQAIIYTNTSYINNEYIIKKDIYNFDTTTTLLLDKNPIENDSNLIGYTKDVNNINDIISLNINSIIDDGDVFYAIRKYPVSFSYDLSFVDENATLIGEIPEKYTNFLYQVVNGKNTFDKVYVTDAYFELTHYDFLGWSTVNNTNYYDNYYHSGDEIVLTNNNNIILYPIFKEHYYTLKINLNGGKYETDETYGAGAFDEQSGTVSFSLTNTSRFYFPYSDIKKEGFKISKVEAEVNPEKLTKPNGYCYSNITEDETLNIYWEIDKYSVSVNIVKVSTIWSIDINLKYSYFDTELNQTITGEITFNDSFSFTVTMGTIINLEASTDIEEHNIAFNKSINSPNKTDTFSYTTNGVEKQQKIYLYIVKLYKIHLYQKDVTSGNEYEIIYKQHNSKLTLPLNIGKKDGYTQYGWSLKEDGSELYYSYIKDSYNQEMTLYAVWTKYVKIYINNTTDIFETKYLKSGETYSLSSAKYKTVEKDGINYYIAGFSTNPNSLEIEYNGTDELTFSNSICWYAIFYTRAFTKTETEPITVTFNFYDKTKITQDTTRYINFSNYVTYTNINFNLQNVDYTKGNITYTSDKIEFVNGEYGNYIIYGWNNSGDPYDDFISKTDDFIVGENTNFYPIYRNANYIIKNIEHKFHFIFNLPVSVFTKSYTLPNTFYLYNSSMTNNGLYYSDSIQYETKYDNLPYDSLDEYNNFYYDNTYIFQGWHFSPYALNPSWTEGSIQVDGPTEWYVVWKRIYDKTINETLTHTFYIDEETTYTTTTLKATRYINITEKLSCDRNFKSIISEGFIERVNSSPLKYFELDSSYMIFLGWATSPDSTEIVFSLNNSQDFNPTTSLNLYPIYFTYITFELIYNYEGQEKIVEKDSTLAYSNYNKTSFRLVNYINEPFKFKIKDFNFTNHANFLGWFDVNFEEKLYFTGDFIEFNNIEIYNSITLFAKIKQPEIISVTFVAEESSININYLDGDEIILDNSIDVEGKVFTGWEINNQKYNVGDKIIVSPNMTFTAVYVDEDTFNSNNNQNQSNQKNKNTTLIIIICIIVFIIIASITTTLIIIIKKKKRKNV